MLAKAALALGWGLLGIVGLFVVVGCAAWWFQEVFLYLPRVPGAIHNKAPEDNEYEVQRSPRNLELEFEDVWIPTKDPKVNLHGWFIKTKTRSEDSPTILFFHGNAGNVGHRLQFVHGFVSSMGFNVLLVDYRGYGKSSGSPGEKALTQDALVTLEHLRLRQDLDPQKIFVMGRSLGGAVAVALASKHARDWPTKVEDFPFRGLILENTFLSIPDLCCDMLGMYIEDEGLCRRIVKRLVWMEWHSHKRITRLPETLPVLFVSGELDEIVPSSHMRALEQLSCSTSKTFESFRSGDHNFTWTEPNYYKRIARWIHATLSPSL